MVQGIFKAKSINHALNRISLINQYKQQHHHRNQPALPTDDEWGKAKTILQLKLFAFILQSIRQCVRLCVCVCVSSLLLQYDCSKSL